jgi:hypothetical protein
MQDTAPENPWQQPFKKNVDIQAFTLYNMGIMTIPASK